MTISTPTLSLQDWLNQCSKQVDAALDTLLPPPTLAPEKLHSAMRYATCNGGKRLRPALVFAAGEMVGANPADLMFVACAVELIHAYSLVHDDLPCMDNDTLRRGKPTVHVQFDEATALLVGDALQTLAFDVLTHPSIQINTSIRLDMIRLLARASGSQGMAGGQAIDLESTGKRLDQTSLAQMHNLKTGALLRASIMLGVLCGGMLDVNTLATIDAFSHTIGLAFQVADDILDATASTATLGKTAGKDAAQDKATYVSLLGLAQAQSYAQTLLTTANTHLAQLGPQNTLRLQQLAELIVNRSS
jgi:farnesyl diphosphate synthase